MRVELEVKTVGLFSIFFFGAIILFIIGYSKGVSVLESIGIILLATINVLYFLFPTAFGFYGLLLYFIPIAVGIVTLVLLIVIRKKNIIICKSCREKMRKRAKFCKKCGTSLIVPKI